jgi:hypothetical protein
LVACAPSLLGGCTDPIIGDWTEREGDCPKAGVLTVDADLGVEGTLRLADAVSGCLKCVFDGQVSNDGAGRYSAEIEFDLCHCQGDRSATVSCTIDDGGGRLGCDVQTGDCGTAVSTWEKDE